jgi:hypothetical protein
MTLYKYQNNFPDVYTGLAQSVETSNTIFTGDAVMVTYSITTSSTTASSWTVMGHLGDGFFAALDSTQWQPIHQCTTQGLYSLDTIPRWLVFQRTASASSTTIALTVTVGP